MRRTSFIVLTIVAFAVATGTALAASAHFKHGSPVFSADKSALTLSASGALAGLGNGDIVVKLDGSGTANTLCTNPGGSTKVPGQNPNFSASGSGAVPASAVKNGNASFSVTTNPPASPISGAPDCPNAGWTETITSITWTSARIRVFQPCTDTVSPETTCGTPVLDQTFTGAPFPLDP
jgi:hypothetical protein